MQLETLDSIDAKIGALFSTSTALLGILAAVLALKTGHMTSLDYTSIAISVALYLVVSFIGGRAYRAKEWKTGPELRSVWRTYSESSESDRALQWAAGNRLRLDYESNKTDVAKKLWALNILFPALVIQSLILVVTLGLVA